MALTRLERFNREPVGWVPVKGETVVLSPKRSPFAQGVFLWTHEPGPQKPCGMVLVRRRVHGLEEKGTNDTKMAFLLEDLRPVDMRKWRNY